MQTWEQTIHRMLLEASKEHPWDIEGCVQSIVWAAMRANMTCPEWAQASLFTLPENPLVDRLAVILVEGTPVKRMVV